MREIKFRVWREEKKIMHWDVNFVEMGGGKDEIVLFDRNKELYIDPLGQSPAFHRNEINIMQFTGLHDKNGKEIYEGDIVIALPIPWREEFTEKKLVSFDDGKFGLTWLFKNNEPPKSQFVALDVFSTEIIGNIHQNPELLKEPA